MERMSEREQFVAATRHHNQCDGCARGLPLDGRIHRGDGYDLIGCTADRYMALPVQPSTIYVVTADLVAETGRITWEYFFADKSMPPAFLDAIMDKPWGWAWRPERRDQSVAFNLFESGKGLLMAGGWEGDGGDWDCEHLNEVPSCSLLMTTEVFDFLNERVFNPFNRPVERFHSAEILYTSKRP